MNWVTKKGIPLLLFAGFVLLLGGTFCPLQRLFGLPCPGCNMMTALYWLAQGQFAVATYYHPCVWLLIPYSLLGLILWWKKGSFSELEKNPWFKGCSVVFFSSLVLVYLYRMVTIFPAMPMVFNEQSLLGLFIKLF